MTSEHAADHTQYVCPSCGYDGSGYRDGTAGWVDAVSEHTREEGPCCGRCCRPVRDPFRCQRCRRWLNGVHYVESNGRTLELCGECAAKVT